MKARAHVYVSGKVQGVFFRYGTLEEAKRWGVKGWVRNLPDERVEATFEGDKEKVDKLVDYCRYGPPGAIVENVEVTWEIYLGEFETFRIMR